jgi:hypothetical protein
VRTHELTVDDVGPIFIGTSQNMELSAPPSSIIPPSAPPAEVVAPTPDGAAAEPVPGAPDAGADGEVLLSLPAVDFVAGGGPYTAPITLSGADRVGALSLTLTYNPSVLRVRGIQEGTFMRAGGVDAAFTPQLDATAGRIDIAAVRPGDTSGAAGTGMVAAVLFEAIAPGPIDLRITGMGSAPDGEDLALRFASVPAVTVP